MLASVRRKDKARLRRMHIASRQRLDRSESAKSKAQEDLRPSQDLLAQQQAQAHMSNWYKTKRNSTRVRMPR
ncbi:uncharacterized protein EKO05_0005446 [Ascochyta rabiei]|nr:uncharacterized protein EKO05_0005446 [Ascochyta rabiei]UPX14978.1 hypothetical protein EKO05_0005446 [Ascochyta rabiei]